MSGPEPKTYELDIQLTIRSSNYSSDRFMLSQTVPLGNRDLKTMITIMAKLEEALKEVPSDG